MFRNESGHTWKGLTWGPCVEVSVVSCQTQYQRRLGGLSGYSTPLHIEKMGSILKVIKLSRNHPISSLYSSSIPEWKLWVVCCVELSTSRHHGYFVVHHSHGLAARIVLSIVFYYVDQITWIVSPNLKNTSRTTTSVGEIRCRLGENPDTSIDSFPSPQLQDDRQIRLVFPLPHWPLDISSSEVLGHYQFHRQSD